MFLLKVYWERVFSIGLVFFYKSHCILQMSLTILLFAVFYKIKTLKFSIIRFIGKSDQSNTKVLFKTTKTIKINLALIN